MGDVGREIATREFEPIPDDIPVPEIVPAVPEPAEVPAAPAREPVRAG